MKNAIKHEMKKMLAYRNYRIALVLGMIIIAAHFISVAYYVNTFFSIMADAQHPMGLDSISLLVLFIPADGWFMTATLFYLVLPVLAALPFGASLHKERKSGYQMQVISHCGKKQYLTAKLLVCAMSGFMLIFTLLMLDVMLCAVVCPLAPVHVLSLISAVMQGSFASGLFYNHPVLYIAVCILMSSVWGAVCAVIALASEMYLSNSFLITVFPCLLMLAITTIMELPRGTLFKGAYELRPLLLMRAAPNNPNPAWYILLWQCGFALTAVIVYYRKGMKRENL
jgi:hypothetical protein